MRRFAFGPGTFLFLGCTHFTATTGTSTSGSTSTGASSGSGGATTSSAGTGTGGGPLATISVVDDTGAPQSGEIVVVSDMAGSVVATLKTDAAGTTTSAIPMSGMVSLLFPSATAPSAIAFASPPVAGPIRFIVPRALQANAPATFDVSYTGNANAVFFFASCAPAGLPATVGVPATTGYGMLAGYVACPGKTTFDVGAVAYDAGGMVSGVKLETGHPFSSLTVNAFDLSGAATSGLASASVQGIPPAAVHYALSVTGRRTGADLFQRSASKSFAAGAMATYATSVDMPSSAMIFDEFDILQELDDGMMASSGDMTHAATVPASAMWLANATAAPTDLAASPDLVKMKFSYTLGAGTVGDVVTLTLSQGNRTWTVFAPPEATGSFILPKLSAPYTGVGLQFAQTSVSTVDTKLETGTGYDAFAGAGAIAAFRGPALLPYALIGYGQFAGIVRSYVAQ